MAKYLVIDNDLIENVIEADDGFDIPGKTILAANQFPAYGVGWQFLNGQPVEPVDPPFDYDAIDTGELNKELAKEGSILRAITELLFQDRNSMAAAVANATTLANLKASFPPVYTKQDFVAALKNKMRT